ncbi:MAG: protein-methionine-sulfoxide reductase heme-binding subunit MsrQ [Azonexus sp.]|nr:protein-methionine-sulfoxide reductase heme-binding subunit MsrQ [Azonexus sp.]MDP3637083.1 protein-methionine-sulfoxide reductase heme-binding subunit MsrQ [Azonexus sp.]MDZ4316182.1 protein-methionine-sulfoxide reductase heme-binding subunit MsrQ [Azonexus sp.]
MTKPPDNRQLFQIKLALFLLCLLPFGRLIWGEYHDNFGADPVAFVQRWTGIWTFNLLLITLCISPLRAMTQLHWLLRLRRMFGLFTFFYALLHFLSFVGFDNSFSINEIANDIFKRPFVIAGFAAFLLLIPLAITSNQWAIRKLGGRKWQELHRNIYLASILAAIHYWWLSKITALYWPLAYSAVLGILLAWRVQERRRKAMPAPQNQAAKPLKFFKQKPD